MDIQFRLLFPALFCMFLSACNPGQEQNERTSTTSQNGSERPPLIVIGVDGAEWSVINRMLDDGKLPGFRRLMEDGTYGHLLNPGPQVSPVVWTTFATGHFAREHGIIDFVYPYTEDGAKEPASAALRREPAIWNILDTQDKTSTVIGYFVSHPAEHINGHIISDRSFQGLDQSIWPESLEPVAEQQRKDVRSDTQSLLNRFLPWSYSAEQATQKDSPYYKAANLVKGRIDGRILADEFLRRMTAQLSDTGSDLLITYFRIVDIVSHSAWLYYDDSDWDSAPDARDVDLLGELVPEAYRYVDEVIMKILDEHGSDANILVISDHGFGSATGEFDTGDEQLTGNHRPDGVFVAHGPDFVSGAVGQVTIMEIFPTLAYLLDVPISDTLPGSIAYPLLSENFTSEHKPSYVDRYDFDWSPVASQEINKQAQEEEMADLRGLGYIGEGVQVATEDPGAAYNFWEIDPTLIARTLHGDITYYLLRNDVAAADRIAREIMQKAPELMPQVLGRTRAKIRWFRNDVPEGSGLAPELETFIERYQ